MVGLFFFFDLFSYSGLRAFFTSDFTNCTTDYAPPEINPTIRCCSQHLMVGDFFFLISSPILDLEHFSQVILRIVLQIMPPSPKLTQPSGAVHSIWWLGFFFFLTFSPILDLEHFSQVILRIVLQIMPPPKLTQPSGAVHSIWWLGFFFFDLFSYSGLRAFFTSDFTNCTTDYVILRIVPPQINPTIRCCSQHLMVGVFFLRPFLLFWT